MAMQIEQDTCTGRGFSDTDANGICAKFKEWIVKTPAEGGPGWYIIQDNSTLPVATAITGVDTATEIITAVAHGFYHGEPIRFSTTGTQISGITTGQKYYAFVIDADTFKVCQSFSHIIAGSFVNLNSTGTTCSVISFGPYIVVSDSNSPSVQDNAKIIKFGYDVSVSGYITVQAFMSKGVTSNSHPMGLFSGYYIKSVDSGSFTYDFRGNDEFLVIQSRIPSDAKWYRVMIDEFEPLGELLESDSSVHGITTTNVSYTAGSTATLTLESSDQVDTFTKNQGYFVYYAGLSSSGRECVKVTYGIVTHKGVADGLTATQITISNLVTMSGTQEILTGARVTPYWHTYYMTASFPTYISVNDFALYQDSGSNRFQGQIPYYSASTSTHYASHDQAGPIDCRTEASVEIDIITRGAQDNGIFIVQKPLIYEDIIVNSQTGMNRVYGEMKNIFICSDTGMTDMETGRTINGNDYVSLGIAGYIISGTLSGTHILVLHTESTI